MRGDSEKIRSWVDTYELEVAGIRFWVPYWINNPELMADPTAPKTKGAFKGKGTPGQLAQSLRRALAESSERPKTGDEMRKFMRAHGLGIDCSGFVYHVLSGWLRQLGARPLAQQLVVARSDVIEAARDKTSWKQDGVLEAELRSWPKLVPLAQVCSRFHKDPRMLTAVATLVHPTVVDSVKRVADVQAGDMIKFTSQEWGDHIALVVERRGSTLIIAESTEPADRLGGVGYDEVHISDPQGGLEGQEGWDRGSSYHPGGRSRDGIWRLKELAG